MKKLTNNKIFIIFFIFLILIISITSNCFANNENIITVKDPRTNTDINIIMPPFYRTNGFNYVLIQNFYASNDFSSFVIHICNEPFYIQNFENGNKFISVPHNSTYYYRTVYTQGKFFNFKTNTIDCTSITFTLDNHNSFDRIVYSDLSCSTYDFNYTNYDILDDITHEVVFHAPVPTTVVMTGLEKVEEIPQMMGKVLEMIIPIGLVILSIGLVIFLMRLVISRLT